MSSRNDSVHDTTYDVAGPSHPLTSANLRHHHHQQPPPLAQVNPADFGNTSRGRQNLNRYLPRKIEEDDFDDVLFVSPHGFMSTEHGLYCPRPRSSSMTYIEAGQLGDGVPVNAEPVVAAPPASRWVRFVRALRKATHWGRK
jgi:hypothetical protein